MFIFRKTAIVGSVSVLQVIHLNMIFGDFVWKMLSCEACEVSREEEGGALGCLVTMVMLESANRQKVFTIGSIESAHRSGIPRWDLWLPPRGELPHPLSYPIITQHFQKRL